MKIKKKTLLSPKTFNYLYSIGASIVILGALFKLLHVTGADIMLILGMGTEAVIFFISAFDEPAREPNWENVYPGIYNKTLTVEEKMAIAERRAKQEAAMERVAESAGVVGGGATIVGGNIPAGGTIVIGSGVTTSEGGAAFVSSGTPAVGGNVSGNAPLVASGNIGVTPEQADQVTAATQKYVNQLNEISASLEKQNAICRFGAGTIVKVINFYAGVHPVITGIEKIPTDHNFLYVSNHRSMFDPLVVMGSLSAYNIAFISKPANMNIPFGGRIAYAVGYLAIDRENDRNAMKTILTAADYLKRGICNIGVYPEGTRSSTNELLPFHAGSLKIAQKAKVPIVVAAGHGTEKIRRFKLFSGIKVYLDILEVIPVETVCSMRTVELSQYIRQIIQDDLDRCDSPAEAEGEAL